MGAATQGTRRHGDLGSPKSLRSARNAEAYLTPGPRSRRARASGLSCTTILANARFFGNDITAVPRMALTVGLKTVLDSRGRRGRNRAAQGAHAEHGDRTWGEPLVDAV